MQRPPEDPGDDVDDLEDLVGEQEQGDRQGGAGSLGQGDDRGRSRGQRDADERHRVGEGGEDRQDQRGGHPERPEDHKREGAADDAG